MLSFFINSPVIIIIINQDYTNMMDRERLDIIK